MVFLQCRRTAGDHAVSSSLRVSGSSAEIILLSGFVGGTTYFWLWSRSVLMDFRKMTDTKPHLHSWWGGLGSSATDWTQRAILRLPTGKGLSQFLRSLWGNSAVTTYDWTVTTCRHERWLWNVCSFTEDTVAVVSLDSQHEFQQRPCLTVTIKYQNVQGHFSNRSCSICHFSSANLCAHSYERSYSLPKKAKHNASI